MLSVMATICLQYLPTHAILYLHNIQPYQATVYFTISQLETKTIYPLVSIEGVKVIWQNNVLEFPKNVIPLTLGYTLKEIFQTIF